MWCVPTAVAALAGMNREQVWLDILAERHERGRRLTNIPGRINEPHGGLHAAEALRVLDRAGFEAIDLWRGTRRMSPEKFLYMIETRFVGGRYLVLQRMHLAHVVARSMNHSLLVSPRFPIAKAWFIRRRVAVPRTVTMGDDHENQDRQVIEAKAAR
jgi:hypothetical protein